MLGRIIEIEGEGRRLSLDRGFLSISGPDGLLGQVPLDDIEAVIISHPAASLTTQVLAALAERGAPVVISDSDFRPCSCLLPLAGHHAQGKRIDAQAEASLPTKKRLWAELVRAKIMAQAAAVERAGVNPHPIRVLAAGVRSGDPDNMEAQAAQRYFPALFGKGFYRYRDGGGANGLLNYGYTVLRAATARAIVSAGLHPSLSINHQSRGEALRLADDMMEPFRPAVDLITLQLIGEGVTQIDTAAKRRLVAVLHADYETEEGQTPLSNVLARACISLAQVFTGDRAKLLLPLTPIPIAVPKALAVAEE